MIGNAVFILLSTLVPVTEQSVYLLKVDFDGSTHKGYFTKSLRVWDITIMVQNCAKWNYRTHILKLDDWTVNLYLFFNAMNFHLRFVSAISCSGRAWGVAQAWLRIGGSLWLYMNVEHWLSLRLKYIFIIIKSINNKKVSCRCCNQKTSPCFAATPKIYVWCWGLTPCTLTMRL